jgi:hypothetical protein
MKDRKATLAALNIGLRDDMSKQPCDSVRAELDGFIGDKHQGFSRVCYEGDTEPEGTVRRNNRQWSGMSQEELNDIQQALDLSQALSPEDLGVNICIEGVDEFSKLPKGSKLVFPSGAVLLVEDYNPPCTEMAEKIAELYTNKAGNSITSRQFIIESKRTRGVVGSIDVPGEICLGDTVVVKRYKAPKLA